MTRRSYIEQVRRIIYGGQPSDDATITINLVNVWLEQAIAYAAKQNMKDNLAIDGIDYVNNSFYTTFKDIAITNENQFLWKVQLPQIPLGIGANEGISTLQIKYQNRLISQTVVWLTINQRSYFENMRPIPNKILAYPQSEFVYLITPLILISYTANVTMISGGDKTDLSSTLNVPNDYFPLMTDYLVKNLMFERNVPVDVTNDGLDAVKTT